jgi:hypothetical protein
MYIIVPLLEVGNTTYNVMGFSYEITKNIHIMYIVYMIG